MANKTCKKNFFLSLLAADFVKNNNKKKRVVKIKAGERFGVGERPTTAWAMGCKSKAENMDNTRKQHKQQSIDIWRHYLHSKIPNHI